MVNGSEHSASSESGGSALGDVPVSTFSSLPMRSCRVWLSASSASSVCPKRNSSASSRSSVVGDVSGAVWFMSAPFVGMVGGTSIVQRKRAGAYQAQAATENVAVEVAHG